MQMCRTHQLSQLLRGRHYSGEPALLETPVDARVFQQPQLRQPTKRRMEQVVRRAVCGSGSVLSTLGMKQYAKTMSTRPLPTDSQNTQITLVVATPGACCVT